ncbi:hypothetical protein MJA45_10120 [Paenibacillus aurantius]|uniref:Uncharacterized protein n=1 Tax=Paenibacillus aurantius TaxID=2918900 RepID=A0AA96LGD9_9BACL|nr:hypothetical protein [Paenibacillus aurantius]WNQ13356.1 hypothetical protein MJA45_10120 [Paenibacillus aurantius]
MGIELTALHWAYAAVIVMLIGCMLFKRDTTLLCTAGILVIALLATHSVSASVSGIFNSFLYALKELLSTILIISVIVAMSRVLSRTGINEVMVSPFTRLMRTPAMAYWTVGLVMMIISWFFWPSPAVALIGVVLLPAAVRVGLPPLAVAVAMNLFGHGIALSGDYVIQAAPKLTADAAGIPVGDVISASVPLVVIMGAVTTVTAFWMIRRDLSSGRLSPESASPATISETEKTGEAGSYPLSLPVRRVMAAVVALLFLIDLIVMFVLKLQGGEATALLGGTALLLLILLTMQSHRGQGLEKITEYLVDGFQFGLKVFGPVIPIAAFFYLGDSAFTELFGKVLPAASAGIVNDWGAALAHSVPINAPLGSLTLAAAGAITGLDGSGFSGISLVGSVAHLVSAAIGSGIATLTALGQIAAIWVGGGTLVPWALIPAAAICGVSPFEVARRNLIPVLTGLAVTTIAAMFLLS